MVSRIVLSGLARERNQMDFASRRRKRKTLPPFLASNAEVGVMSDASMLQEVFHVRLAPCLHDFLRAHAETVESTSFNRKKSPLFSQAKAGMAKWQTQGT